MSDWEFLHEMHARGCSAEEIADAAAVGYAPWDGWRQLPWPVDDNYLGRLKACAGRVLEAGLP